MMKMKNNEMVCVAAGIVAGLLALLCSLSVCAAGDAAEVGDGGVMKTAIVRPRADAAVVAGKAFELGFSVVGRAGGARGKITAVVVEPAQVTWILKDGDEKKMAVRALTKLEWVELRGLVEETRGELGFTYKGKVATDTDSYMSLFESADARGMPVMNCHGCQVRSLEAVMTRLGKLKADGKAKEVTIIEGLALAVLKAWVGGHVVEKLAGAEAVAAATEALFKDGFVVCDLALTDMPGDGWVWVVQGDRVTWARWDSSAKEDGRPWGWRGRALVLKKEEQEKVQTCLKDMSDHLGFAYENTFVRDGSVRTLYATGDAKGPVVLKSTNEDVAPLQALMVILYGLKGNELPWKIPVLEDAQVIEVMHRATGLGKDGKMKR